MLTTTRCAATNAVGAITDNILVVYRIITSGLTLTFVKHASAGDDVF